MINHSISHQFMNSTYCTIHPNDPHIPAEFYYGNMKVRRRRFSNDKVTRQLHAVFHSFIRSGVLPQTSTLTGDYLEHSLTSEDATDEKPAGRYIGIIFPNDSYQYLRIDGESIGINKTKIEKPDKLVILTDTCLFCTANAIATLENGQTISVVAPQTIIDSPIISLKIEEEFCPYEVDSILRLTSLINSLNQKNTIISKVILAMPTVEYYFYLMDAYNDKYITTDMMLKWIQQVDNHSKRIVDAIRKRLGTPSESCQPLEGARSYIYDCIERGIEVSFDAVKKLLSESSDLWHSVLPLTQPSDWKDLNYTNYAISVLISSRSNRKNSQLLLDIENPSEQRILRNASKIAKQLKAQGNADNFSSVGIYPHEKVFFPSSGQCDGTFPRLYYMGDKQSISKILYRKIIEANKQKMID